MISAHCLMVVSDLLFHHNQLCLTFIIRHLNSELWSQIKNEAGLINERLLTDDKVSKEQKAKYRCWVCVTFKN